MKLVYTTHTETIVVDKKSVTTDQLDKMLLAIAKKMYDDGDIVLNEKVEDDIVLTEALAKYYKIQD